MNMFIAGTAALAMCCLCWTAQAKPSHISSNHQLYGVPDEHSYGKLHYPEFDILDLGEHRKDEIPPKTIKVSKTITIKEPHPYPVKVPVKVPFPVHIPKPYPVIQTKIIHVPHHVPVHVEKPVPVPIEVPKPYPVPSDEIKAPAPDAWASFGGGFSGGQQQFGEHHQQGGFSPANSAFGDHQSSGGGSYGDFSSGDEHQEGSSDNQHQELDTSYGVPGHEPGAPLGGYNVQEPRNNFEEENEHGEEDQSQRYKVQQQRSEGKEDD